jgi:hypothetical protein
VATVYGYVLNLSSNDGQMFAQNPREFEETYSAVWNDRAGLGAPHQRRQFKSSNNPTVSIDLTFNRKVIADMSRKLGTYDEAKLRLVMTRAKAFFQSLTVPRKHQGSVLVQSPPAVLLVWPKVLKVRANLDRATFRNAEFAADGSLVDFVASLSFTEQRTRDLFSDDVLRLGSMRGV